MDAGLAELAAATRHLGRAGARSDEQAAPSFRLRRQPGCRLRATRPVGAASMTRAVVTPSARSPAARTGDTWLHAWLPFSLPALNWPPAEVDTYVDMHRPAR